MIPQTHLSPKVEWSGDLRIITFEGGPARDVDNPLARELAGRTEGVGEGDLLLDFTNVQSISSVELGTLIELHKKTRETGGRLTLFNLSSRVFEVFAITGLDHYLKVCREDGGAGNRSPSPSPGTGSGARQGNDAPQ
jgi:anti-anti-sigma factor